MAQATLVRPNPALTRGFARVGVMTDSAPMTLQGTVNKTFFLTLLMVIGGTLGWATVGNGGSAVLWVALIGATILGIGTSFKPTWAPKTAPIYALLEGFVLGSISELTNSAYQGVALTAMELTLSILVALLVIYSKGIIKVTQKFRVGVAAATFGIFVVFAITLIANAFGASIGLVQGQGVYAVGFSLLVIVLACANLLVDFDFVQRGVNAGYPQYMEWYGAFSIMVTVVWLYIELLRLLSQLRR